MVESPGGRKVEGEAELIRLQFSAGRSKVVREFNSRRLSPKK